MKGWCFEPASLWVHYTRTWNANSPEPSRTRASTQHARFEVRLMPLEISASICHLIGCHGTSHSLNYFFFWVSAISSGHVFSFVYLFTAIYRNTFGSNSTICHQFRGNSARVNERDGGGNVSITAGLGAEWAPYVFTVFVCVRVLERAGVCACTHFRSCTNVGGAENRGSAEIIEKKRKKKNTMSIW